MSAYPTARTVGELIAELQKVDPNAVVITSEPTDGVQIIPQNPPGKVLIARLPRVSLPVGANGIVSGYAHGGGGGYGGYGTGGAGGMN
ncbi:MAG: hypothetical protein ABFD92_17460 [Planctomycetaceae bacterium]